MRRHVFPRFAPKLQNALCMIGEQLARFGQAYAAARALQERRASRFFEDAQLNRYRRLREMHFFGSARHTTEPCDGVKGSELAEGGVF
jgi:hypothetical protein